jgi:hypothetical protein
MNRYDHNNVLIDPKDYKETYQSKLACNKLALIALEISYGKHLETSMIHKLAHYLCNFEDNRLEQNKSTTNDHLKQEAVKWIRVNG